MSTLYASNFRVPESMIAQLAYGLEPPEDVAARYGIGITEFLRIEGEPWFKAAVARARTELVEKGENLLLAKFRMMAEDTGEAVFKDVQNSPDPDFKLKALALFGKYGGLEPKQNTGPVERGPAFSIQINIPTIAPSQPREIKEAEFTVIEIPAAPPEEGPTSKPDWDRPRMEMQVEDSLPPEPKRSEGFRMPDFDLAPLATSARPEGGAS